MVVAVATLIPSIANTTGALPNGEPPPSRVAVNVTLESAGDGFALGVTLRVEVMGLTATAVLLQVLGAKLVSPEYVQVMLSVPAGSAEVGYVAALLMIVTVESAVPLLEKVTVPVGVSVIPSTWSSSEPPMAAVNVTGEPADAVVGFAVSVLMLGVWLTVSVNEAVALA